MAREDWIPEAVWDRATQTWVDLPEGTTWADLEASPPAEGDDE